VRSRAYALHQAHLKKQLKTDHQTNLPAKYFRYPWCHKSEHLKKLSRNLSLFFHQLYNNCITAPRHLPELLINLTVLSANDWLQESILVKSNGPHSPLLMGTLPFAGVRYSRYHYYQNQLLLGCIMITSADQSEILYPL
jgi:hypothetical protein